MAIDYEAACHLIKRMIDQGCTIESMDTSGAVEETEPVNGYRNYKLSNSPRITITMRREVKE